MDRELTVRYLLVAAFGLVAGLGLLYWAGRTGPRDVTWSVPGVDLVWLVAAVAVGMAAVPSYLDDGLLAGWALGFVAFVGQLLAPAVVPARAFDQPVLLGIATAFLLGVGSVGFGIGAGVHWVRESIRGSGRTIGA